MDRASPHHRHQSSLEGIIRFSSESPLEVGERARAKQKFYRIVSHFQTANGSLSSSRQYNRPLLVRLTYEHARSEESQDIFLRAFFQSMALSVNDENDLDFESNEEDLGSGLSRFADYLFDNFFLPCKIEESLAPLTVLMPPSACFVRQNAAALSVNSFCNPTSARGRRPRFYRDPGKSSRPAGLLFGTRPPSLRN